MRARAALALGLGLLASLARPAAAQQPLCPDGQRSYFGKCPTGPATAPQPAVPPGPVACNASRPPGGSRPIGCDPPAVPPPIAPPPVTPPTVTPPFAPLPPAPPPVAAGEPFRDCADGCPAMVALPAGSFTMGSGPDEVAREQLSSAQAAREQPAHRVAIAYDFAVSQDAITFAEWARCVADGGCGGYEPTDMGWGRGRRPVIAVSWLDAQAYVRWLVQRTGKPYRLLSEAEYEFAARAGTTTARYWGDALGQGLAACAACGSQWDRGTAPTGSFRANPWELHDILGNVFTWTQDCWNGDYLDAPADGSPRPTGDCERRSVRGGGWHSQPVAVRAAYRWGEVRAGRFNNIGFRVARTLP